MTVLRYRYRHLRLATEVDTPSGVCDVLSLRNGRFHEFEVKTSVSDLTHDMKKMEGKKHYTYEHGNKGIHFCPHYFSLVVPAKMEEKAIAFSDMYEGKYGVYIWNDMEMPNRLRHGSPIPFERKRDPKKLISGRHKFHSRVKRKLMMRMSSELITASRRLLAKSKID